MVPLDFRVGQVWVTKLENRRLSRPVVITKVEALGDSVFVTVKSISDIYKDFSTTVEGLEFCANSILKYSPDDDLDTLRIDMRVFVKHVFKQGFLSGSKTRGTNDNIINREYEDQEIEKQFNEIFKI